MNAHSIRITRTGQPTNVTETIAIHEAAGCECYGWYRNGGQYELSPKDYAPGALSLKQIGANLRAAFPGARVRVTSRRVKIAPSKAMAARLEQLDATWQAMAAEGRTHADMRQVMINA